jgi:DNA primase
MDEVLEIKRRLDIVDVVSSYLTLKKAGTNLKANCPFHQEKTPSFMVSPERQSFKCFGCGEGGDIFTFIEKIEGLDFYNALKVLADRAGVTLKRRSITYGQNEYKADRKTALFEINDLAMRVYHKILQDHLKAEAARKYLKKRKIGEEAIEEFNIGYAPNSWDFIIRFLVKHGYKEEEMFAAGLVVRGEKGQYYDRFRGRIIFPINNIMGQTVAFTSRVLIDSAKEAKYLNSADSPIYTKGDVLYGLDKARMAIKEKDLAVVVEGNMDVIACHQAGYKNVVASSGTALTEQQLKILTRYGSEIAFCFDTDSAGETAMKRAIILAVKNDLTAKIVAIPAPFKDPDEAISNNPKNWERAVLTAKPALEYWIDLLIRQNPELDTTDKKKIAKEILPVIKMTYSPIEREASIKYLAEKLSVSEKSLLDTLSKSKSERIERVEPSTGKKHQELTIFERLLALIWHDPKLAEKIPEDLIETIDLKNDGTFLKMVKAKEIDKEKVPSKEAAQLEALLMTIASEIDLSDGETNVSEFSYLIKRIQTDQREELRQEFAKKIKEAEQAGDHEAIRKLLAEFSSLIK